MVANPVTWLVDQHPAMRISDADAPPGSSHPHSLHVPCCTAGGALRVDSCTCSLSSMRGARPVGTDSANCVDKQRNGLQSPIQCGSLLMTTATATSATQRSHRQPRSVQ
jgi:hypothetical protein